MRLGGRVAAACTMCGMHACMHACSSRQFPPMCMAAAPRLRRGAMRAPRAGTALALPHESPNGSGSTLAALSSAAEQPCLAT